MYWQLTDNPNLFPNPYYGEEDGLIAVGGDLSPERLVAAYSRGIFPWYDYKEGEQILWWCPLKRFVIFPHEIHISHSMRQLMRSGRYEVTLNHDFDAVINACSTTDARHKQVGAWLGNDMIEAYKELHRMGLAASVEVWDAEGTLVGGLYGVNIGCNFFGESMFSRVPNASKLALIHLAHLLEEDGGIIDCQFHTPHLESMGGRYIPYSEYMNYLNKDRNY